MTLPETSSFKSFPLNRELTRALSVNSYRSPTAIQQAVIGDILSGKDVIGCARTGSGKSLAFMLPVAQRLLTPAERNVRGPRCIIMSPTRELAHQLFKKLKELLTFSNLRCELMTSASDLKDQEKYLKKPVDFMIATPGRLIDHTQNGTVNYNRLETLILDEADRMLDMGFRDDLNYIIDQCPKERQTLLFSATLDHPETLEIARTVMTAPIEHIVDTVDKPLDNIKEHFYRLKGIIQKFDLLTHLIKTQPSLKSIVFITSRAAVEQLSARLNEQDLEVVSLHGKMTKTARDEAMLKFKSLASGTLVTTDLGARGLDVLDVNRVINFDMPTKPEDYVHRIGRTGRLERKGTAISFVSTGKDTESLNAIREYLGRKIFLENDPTAPVKKQKNHYRKSKTPAAKAKRGNFKGNTDGLAPFKKKKN
jgi:superfamily II DNA/RNA helicase